MNLKTSLTLAILFPAITDAAGYYALSWTGNGTYLNVGVLDIHTQLTPAVATSLASGDFDGDGQNDLVASFTSGGVWVRTEAAGWSQISSTAATYGVAAGDTDGDGDDEVVMSRAGGVSKYDFNTAVTTLVNPNAAEKIATGDLNGDGNDEVLMSFSAFGVYANDGASAWQISAIYANQLVAGDIDGDGNDEALMSYSAGGVYANQGSLGANTLLHSGYSDLGLLAADINGDGDDEVILDFTASGIWANDGTSGSDTLIDGLGAEKMATGDVDGDGRDELLVSWNGVGTYKVVPGGANTKLSLLASGAVAVVSAPPPPPPAPLPFLETFEVADGVTTGTIDGQNGWVATGGTADVQSATYHTGSQALQMQNAQVSHDLTSEGSAIWLHFQARCAGAPDSIPVAPANTTLSFFVNTNLNLVVYSNTVPVELGIQVPTNVWIRFDVYCDYGDQYWDLSVDGTNVAAGLPLYSTNSQLDSMTFVAGDSFPVYIDQIDMEDTEQTADGLPDSDGDQIPDWWEQKYFAGVTSVVAGNPSGNNGLTYLDTYVAGVSPFAFDPFTVALVSGGNGMSWDSVPSRLYSVYWSSNLVDGFIWQQDLPYPASEFVDSVHSNEAVGFYQLKVQVQ